MLVVRRRAGESILLGDDIEIEVVEISRTRVKLGIKAPREVAVVRRESGHLAVENRSAAALLSEGSGGMGEILRLLEGMRESFPKTKSPRADM